MGVMVFAAGLPQIQPRMIFACYAACMSPFILQAMLTPRKFILDAYNKQTDMDSDWFKSMVWQTKMGGVQTAGILAFVLGVAMTTDDRAAQIRTIGVLALMQVGVLYVLCTLKYTEGLLRPWHTNVIYLHCLIFMGLIIGYLLVLQNNGVPVKRNIKAPSKALFNSK